MAVGHAATDHNSLGDPPQKASEISSAVRRVSDNPTVSKTFTTDFPLAETPIAQSGVWQHLGISWAYVRSVAHHAVGTQTGSGGYDDSYAYLTGFGPDQTAQATLWIDPGHRRRLPRSGTLAPLG